MKLLTAALALSLMLAMTQAEAAPKDEGPDLPWPCWMIRLNAASKGLTPPLTREKRATIARLEKEHGITPKQHRQAEACFPKTPRRGSPRPRV